MKLTSKQIEQALEERCKQWRRDQHDWLARLAGDLCDQAIDALATDQDDQKESDKEL